MNDAVVDILLLEDGPGHSEAIRRALEASGLKAVVRVAGTLREYQEAVAARPPDIALLDLVLPDGRTLDMLTSLPDACPFPILIMTSHGNEQTAEEAIKAGALDYIVKSPEALATMPHAVERALREWSALQERKRAETALRESEEKYRLLIDTASESIVVAQDGLLKFVNPAALGLLGGYSEQELIDRPFPEFIHPDDRSMVVENYRQRMANEAVPPRYAFRVVTREGIAKWVEINAALIEWQGKPATLNFLTDITERKQAEAERETVLMRQEGINRLRQSLLEPMPLEQRLKRITDSIVQLFDADFCRIWLIRPGDLCERGCIHAGVREGPHMCRDRDRCLHLLVSSGRYTRVDGQGPGRVPFGSHMIGRVASDEDHKFITNDVQNDPRVPDHEWARELGLVSFMGYQISVPGGQTTGVLALFSKRRFAPAEEAMLDGLSGTVGLVVQQAEREEALRQAVASTIQVLGLTVEARDPSTAGHQQRTTILAEAIAREMGLPPKRIDGLRMAGQVHDIGKISIPSEILNKPAELTTSEFKLVRTHPKKGFAILKNVEFPWPLAEIIYQHHERMDGSGYPRGLKGEDILMEARILAVADTVEAMVSNRPYRPAPGIEAALAEVEKNKGIFYDADAAETCLMLFRKEGFRFPE